MPRQKINYGQIVELARGGMKRSNICKKLGITKGTVSKALKNLDIKSSEDLPLGEVVDFVDREIDPMQQLTFISNVINKELTSINRGLEEAEGHARLVLQQAQIQHTAEIRK